MSTLATIRAAIVAKLNTVAGIGQVHNYERFARAEKDFRALYETADLKGSGSHGVVHVGIVFCFLRRPLAPG